jgi:hypothetical protein
MHVFILLWLQRCMVYGLVTAICGVIKAIYHSRFSDPHSPASTIFFAASCWLFGAGVVWSFLYTLVVPFFVGIPNFRVVQARLKRVFACCGLLSSFWPVPILLQLLKTEEKTRMRISAAFFVGMGMQGVLVMVVLGLCTWKVCDM